MPRLRLKQAIVATGDTQREWSMRWRIPECRISALVRGRAEPTEHEKKIISSDLDVPIGELFVESEQQVA